MRHPTLALVVLAAGWTALSAVAGTVREIEPPTHPLPEETASAGVSTFSFIAYGDTRSRLDGVELQPEHALVVDSMLETIRRLESSDHPVRFVLQSGDAVVDGRKAGQWNRSFVDIINRLTAGAGVPYFLAAGNHDVTEADDVDAPGRVTGLGNYLQATNRLIPPAETSRRLAGYPTYAFGYGNTFVVAIDSNLADDEVQFGWVASQLEELDRGRYQHVIALFHHPVFSSGPHGGPTVEPQTAALRALYAPLFRRHGVRMTISGHDHVFEHWVERYRDGNGNPMRTDHIVTGGGGAPPYGYAGEPDLAAFLAAGAGEAVQVEHLVRPEVDEAANPYHYLVVTVEGGDVTVEVIAVGRAVEFQPYRSSRMEIAPGVSR